MNLSDYKTPEAHAHFHENVWSESNYGARRPLSQRDIDFAKDLERRLLACREVLEDLARYPIAQSYPDGPCIEREDMNLIKEVLALTEPPKP